MQRYSCGFSHTHPTYTSPCTCFLPPSQQTYTCWTEHIHRVYNTHLSQRRSSSLVSSNNATLKYHHPLSHPQFQSHPLTTRPLLHRYHDMCPLYPAPSPTNESATMHNIHNKEHYTYHCLSGLHSIRPSGPLAPLQPKSPLLSSTPLCIPFLFLFQSPCRQACKQAYLELSTSELRGNWEQ